MSEAGKDDQEEIYPNNNIPTRQKVKHQRFRSKVPTTANIKRLHHFIQPTIYEDKPDMLLNIHWE